MLGEADLVDVASARSLDERLYCRGFMRDFAAAVTEVHVVIDDHTRDTIRVHPETRYATSGGYHIAYQVVGNGPLDLVFGAPFVTHVELFWEEPRAARFLRRLASFSRLIVFDKRGTGLSDRVSLDALPTLEQRMDDLRSVMDASGSERAALFGSSEAGLMAMLFAATYPDRVSALILPNQPAEDLTPTTGMENWGSPSSARSDFLHFRASVRTFTVGP